MRGFLIAIFISPKEAGPPQLTRKRWAGGPQEMFLLNAEDVGQVLASLLTPLIAGAEPQFIRFATTV